LVLVTVQVPTPLLNEVDVLWSRARPAFTNTSTTVVQNDTADAHAISDAPVNSRDGSFPK
jgi:hypothetical protein